MKHTFARCLTLLFIALMSTALVRAGEEEYEVLETFARFRAQTPDQVTTVERVTAVTSNFMGIEMGATVQQRYRSKLMESSPAESTWKEERSYEQLSMTYQMNGQENAMNTEVKEEPVVIARDTTGITGTSAEAETYLRGPGCVDNLALDVADLSKMLPTNSPEEGASWDLPADVAMKVVKQGVLFSITPTVGGMWVQPVDNVENSIEYDLTVDRAQAKLVSLKDGKAVVRIECEGSGSTSLTCMGNGQGVDVTQFTGTLELTLDVDKGRLVESQLECESKMNWARAGEFKLDSTVRSTTTYK